VNSVTHMRVPVSVARELDAIAKSNSNLWDDCLLQDFNDNPKSRGRAFLLRREVEALGFRTTPSHTAPVPGHQSSPPSQPRQQNHLEWQFKGNSVAMSVDLEGGWRATAQAWCFRSSADIGLQGDHRLHVTVTVLEDVRGQWYRRISTDCADAREADDSLEVDAIYPQFARTSKKYGASLRCMLENAAVTFEIALLDSSRELNLELPWVNDGRHWTFRWAEYGIYERVIRRDSRCTSRPFKIEIGATLHEPPPSCVPTQYEYDTPFPSAGLPSLGKRR